VRLPPAIPQSPPKRTPELLTPLSPSLALASLLSAEHAATGVACYRSRPSCSLCRPSPGPGVLWLATAGPAAPPAGLPLASPAGRSPSPVGRTGHDGASPVSAPSKGRRRV